MTKLTIFTFLIALLTFIPQAACALDRIVVVSDMWMPYNGVPNSPKEGYGVDILRSILEPQGYEVAYIERPWNRAVEEVRLGKADMVIGAFKFEMPSFVFPRHEFGVTVMGVYTNDKSWKFTGPKSLEKIKMGIVQGYGYRQWVLDEAQKHPERFYQVHGDDAFPRLISMLVQNRVQAIPSSSAPMDYYIAENDLGGRVFFAGFGPNPEVEKLYYALSPAHKERSEKIAAILDKGIQDLRKSGELRRILGIYGLEDWVKPSSKP